MKQHSRTEARAEAFKLAFQMTLKNEDIETGLQEIEEDSAFSDNLEYIKGVVYGIREKNDEIEAVIEKHLKKGWKLSRLSKVSLTVLKLAVYEMLYVEDVPHGVAINEAVELVKQYDDPELAAFVNGVLAGIYRSKD